MWINDSVSDNMPNKIQYDTNTSHLYTHGTHI